MKKKRKTAQRRRLSLKKKLKAEARKLRGKSLSPQDGD
jgi:hypothetical protein